jgi:hypothetical protein
VNETNIGFVARSSLISISDFQRSRSLAVGCLLGFKAYMAMMERFSCNGSLEYNGGTGQEGRVWPLSIKQTSYVGYYDRIDASLDLHV